MLRQKLASALLFLDRARTTHPISHKYAPSITRSLNHTHTHRAERLKEEWKQQGIQMGTEGEGAGAKKSKGGKKGGGKKKGVRSMANDDEEASDEGVCIVYCFASCSVDEWLHLALPGATAPLHQAAILTMPCTLFTI
jgi:hypothetical protein